MGAERSITSPEERLLPSETWRQLSIANAELVSPPRGLDAVWHAASGRAAQIGRRTAHYLDLARRVEARHDETAGMTTVELRTSIHRTSLLFRLGRETDDDLIESFALLREVAARTLGLCPYPVQLAAGLIIHDGRVAEMATGEGKTLAASIPTIIAGWRGRGCHVVTFNSYLATRDAELMAPLYDFCRVTVASIDEDMSPEDRQSAYRADVTYCTSKDVAADFLRDRLSLGRHTRLASAMLASLVEGERSGVDGQVLRGLDTAIVDEADSVLIDEAVTPLIISGSAPNDEQVEAYETAARLARRLRPDVDYHVDHRYREVTLTDAGRAALEEQVQMLGGVWAAERGREERVVQALTARELFLRDRQYIIDDESVVIVDESTGRLMPDRMWRSGLHQAVEAKEGLTVNPPKDTLARISFQRFFRMYRRMGGTTGTAWEARGELWQVYGLPTVVVPTHRPSRRRMEPDRVHPDDESKWVAVVDEIRAVHATGRPILVGTVSVEASEDLGRRLTAAGLEHQVLNAVRHAQEAAIVARAGEHGRITIATNMAGRGTDIKLGPGVPELGGLHVIATERHETGRIDRQLFGRAARQGDPGSAVVFASLDDRICRGYASRAMRRLAQLDPQRAGARLIISAQRRAERMAARQRRAVLKTDDWLDRFLGFAGKQV